MAAAATASPGTLIRAARRRRGITQQQLAAGAGTTQSAISRIERDRVSPTVATLAALLEVAGERLELGIAPAHATMLRAGDPDWARLEAEKRDALRPGPDATAEELLRRGINLSRQAARLRRAVEGPSR